MLLMLLIVGIWLAGGLLVLGLCAAAADGDRALAEPALAIPGARRFARA